MVTWLLARLFPDWEHHVDGLHREMLTCLPRQGAVLDLGCGANDALESYRTDTLEVWGTDLQTHPHLRYPEWFRPLGPDGRIPFPEASFDVVCARWVLEHVREPGPFLAEVSRVLKPGGRFVAHTVNTGHYVTWLRRAIGLLPHSLNQKVVRWMYGRDCHDTFPAYYRLNTERRLRRATAGTPLHLVRLTRYPDPAYFSFWEPLERLAARVDRLLDRLHPALGRLYFTAVFHKQEACERPLAAAA
jgi:SAM-dependent methyltransferase